MADREYRAWVRQGGGLRRFLADLRVDRALQDPLLGSVLLGLGFTLLLRGDYVSTAVVYVVAMFLFYRSSGGSPSAAPVHSADGRTRWQRPMFLVHLSVALVVAAFVLAAIWVLWVDSVSRGFSESP